MKTIISSLLQELQIRLIVGISLSINRHLHKTVFLQQPMAGPESFGALENKD